MKKYIYSKNLLKRVFRIFSLKFKNRKENTLIDISFVAWWAFWIIMFFIIVL